MVVKYTSCLLFIPIIITGETLRLIKFLSGLFVKIFCLYFTIILLLSVLQACQMQAYKNKNLDIVLKGIKKVTSSAAVINFNLSFSFKFFLNKKLPFFKWFKNHFYAVYYNNII